MGSELKRVFARSAGCGLVALACALTGRADEVAAVTANWQPTAAGTYSFTNLVNWDTERIPTNSADTIHFAPDAAALAGAQNIDFPNSNWNSPWMLGTLDGAENQTLRLSKRWYVGGPTSARVHLANPNGFSGTYTTQDYKSYWIVQASDAFTPYLARVTATAAPVLRIDGSGEARVGNVVGGGRLEKHDGANGATGNRLAVDDIEPINRASTRIRTNGGTLTLGLSTAWTTPPVADPALWLDAARADTITADETPDENGRRFVSAWRDAGGGEVVAGPLDGVGRPFLGTDAEGRAYVDFGGYTGTDVDEDLIASYVAAYGPSASLKLSDTITGVREAFVVWADWTSRNTCVFVLGNTDSFDLHRKIGGMGLLESTYHGDLHTASDTWSDETWIDGVKRSWGYSSDFSACTVASVNVNENGAAVNTLANDRIKIRKGGCRIYEVVLYTRELTSAERQSVNAYLLAKWKHRDEGLQELEISKQASAQTLCVPEGKALNVGTLTFEAGGTLTKTGAGALNVASVANGDTTVCVTEGSVSFNGAGRTPDGLAPAEAPLLWLDASKADSLIAKTVEGDESGRAYISEWRDWRAPTVEVATVEATAAAQGHYPFIVANAANGLPAIDFGDGWYTEWGERSAVTNDSTSMTFKSYQTAREAFTVVRMKMPNGVPTKTNRGVLNPGIFSQAVNNFGFPRYGSASLLTTYADTVTSGARWMLDGTFIEPFESSFTPGTDDFHVISFAAAQDTHVDGLAFERTDNFGGLQICETLIYNRPLTTAERTATVAYLRRKWQGVEPQAATRRTVSSLSYATGVTPVLESDVPLTVGKVVLPSDAATLTVTGGGAVHMADMTDLTAGQELVVDGGALVLSDPDVDMPEPLYHFDASVASSLVTETGDDGTTFVTRWNDVRGNGVYAEAASSKLAVAKPTLRTVETRTGLSMPVIDFGDVKVDSVDSTTAAGMNIRGVDGLVQELHVIYSDAHENCSGYGHRFIFTDSDVNNYPFHRSDSNGQLFVAYDSAAGTLVKNGYVGLDGVATPWNYKMTDLKFHLISAAPAGAVYVRTIALDRHARAGGSYQGELIAFRQTLSSSQRAALQKRLMKKWFGETPELSSARQAAALRVLNGGRLTFGGDLELAENTTLTLDLLSATNGPAVTVTGALTLPAALRVAVTVPENAKIGTWRTQLISAASCTERTGTHDWKVTTNAENASFGLERDTTGLWLVSRPRGTVLFLR